MRYHDAHWCWFVWVSSGTLGPCKCNNYVSCLDFCTQGPLLHRFAVAQLLPCLMLYVNQYIRGWDRSVRWHQLRILVGPAKVPKNSSWHESFNVCGIRYLWRWQALLRYYNFVMKKGDLQTMDWSLDQLQRQGHLSKKLNKTEKPWADQANHIIMRLTLELLTVCWLTGTIKPEFLSRCNPWLFWWICTRSNAFTGWWGEYLFWLAKQWSMLVTHFSNVGSESQSVAHSSY